MLFVDNPRGTGYSFSNAGTLCGEWTCYANDFESMLRQFIGAFQLSENEVYITGESYGGHYVPASAFMVAVKNAAGATPKINLQGVAIGNGFVAPLEMVGGAFTRANSGPKRPRQKYPAALTPAALTHDPNPICRLRRHHF